MKTRHTLLITVCCLATATVFGQSARIAGKWGTDGAANRGAMTVMLDLKVDATNNVTGSITQYGVQNCNSPNTSLQISSGKVMESVVTFVTTMRKSCPTAGTAIASREPDIQVTWTGTLGNDNSLFVTSVAVNVPVTNGASGAGAASGGGSRNPLGTPTNPLARGGDVATPRGGSGGATATPSFPSMVMHRL